MEEFNTYEYTVEHSKKDRKLKTKKLMLILFYTVYCSAGIAFAAFSGVGVLVAPLMALIPVTLWMIVFFTWRYVSPEYKYSMTSGVVSFTTVYGARTEKKLFEIRIAEAERIAPIKDISDSELKEYSPEIEYNCVSTQDTPDGYCMLFKSKDGKRAVCRFEATARAIKILKYYNSKTVKSEVRY